MSDDDTPPAVDWAVVRAEYVEGTMLVKDIAARHGVSLSTLKYHMLAEDWPRRLKVRSPVVKLKLLVQRRLGELETLMGEGSQAPEAADTERGIRIIDVLTRTLDKILELERKHRAVNGKVKSAVHAVVSQFE